MQVGCGSCAGLDWAQKGSKWRLLQLFLDQLNEGVVLVLVPGDDLVILLDGEATLAEGNDIESGVLVAFGVVDDGLKKATRLGEEGLGSLLRSGVSTDAVDDNDLCEVAAVSKDVHARHSSSLDIGGDGNGNHGLTGLAADHAQKVQRSGGSVKTQLEGVENQASLGSKLDDRDQFR